LIEFPFNYCTLLIHILVFVVIYKVPHVPFHLTLSLEIKRKEKEKENKNEEEKKRKIKEK